MATQTVEAVDHKLLAAGEWVETGEWDEVLSPYDGTVVGRVARGDAALVDQASPPPTRPSSRPTSPSMSARRCSTAPPSWSASGSTSWR